MTGLSILLYPFRNYSTDEKVDSIIRLLTDKINSGKATIEWGECIDGIRPYAINISTGCVNYEIWNMNYPYAWLCNGGDGIGIDSHCNIWYNKMPSRITAFRFARALTKHAPPYPKNVESDEKLDQIITCLSNKNPIPHPHESSEGC
jgi:hypothetical protein